MPEIDYPGMVQQANQLANGGSGGMAGAAAGFMNYPPIRQWLEGRHQKDFGTPGAADALSNVMMGANFLPMGKMPRPVQSGTMDSLHQIAFDTTQAGIGKLLGLDKPPPPRTHQQYVESKTKKMSPEEILNSDALWAASRDLAAQTNIPMSKAYSQLGERVIGRPLTAEEFAKQMTAGAQYGLLSPRKLYD